MKYEICYKTPKSMLNKGSGFLADYTHSLNPYAGCSFACSYCYVRRSPINMFRQEEWGSWVDVKIDADTLLRKELRRAKTKGEVTIFMSSSTDPYQPVEYKEQLTRSLLAVMAEEQPDFLLVQTRSPLVARDIDLLQRMSGRVRVSMTIETDLEEVRKQFTPFAPPVQARLKALAQLKEAGIPAQAAVAPILPSSEAFAQLLKEVVDRVCVDDYYMGDGSGGKRTRSLGLLPQYEALGLEEWYTPEAYQRVAASLLRVFKQEQVLISQAGFAP